MKEPKFKIKDDAVEEIGLGKSEIEDQIRDAVELAETLASQALTRLNKVLEPKKKKQKKERWENDALIKKFFGDEAPKLGQMKKTRRRVKRAHGRLANKRLVVRVLPQPRKKPGLKARNMGFILTPKRFQIFPAWFSALDAEYDGNKKGEVSSNSDLRRAAIIVHELNHDWFADQKLKGDKVYGEKMAKKLADAKPRKARRSAENFEWFCMRIQDPTGKL